MSAQATARMGGQVFPLRRTPVENPTLCRLRSPEEVAAVLGVSRRQVYHWLASGKLKALKAGQAWRIPERALVEFLAQYIDPSYLLEGEKGGGSAGGTGEDF